MPALRCTAVPWRRIARTLVVLTVVALAAGPSLAAVSTRIRLVKNIKSGGGSDPTPVACASTWCLVLADDGENGREPWRTDGTEAGTWLLRDIMAGPVGSAGGLAQGLEGVVVFSANSADRGCELWRSDGTQAGTHLVMDIRPGPDPSAPTNGVRVGNQVFFLANDGVHGVELWRTDGTESGTWLVTDLTAGEASSSFRGMVEYKGRLVAVVGGRLISSDGTEAGTTEVLPTGVLSVSRVGDTLAIWRCEEAWPPYSIWRSDGTETGTSLLKAGFVRSFDWLFAGATKLYFRGDDGVHGREIWVSDLSIEGTLPLREIAAMASASGWSALGVLGDTLLYDGSSAQSAAELWRTDGTEGGTGPVAELDPGAARASIVGGTVVGQTLVFVARDATHGSENWVTDGTQAGTRLIADLAPEGGSSVEFPDARLAFGTMLLMRANDGNVGQELWVIDVEEVVPRVRRHVGALH